MISVTELWLPILLSAVFVFVASSILHMVVQIHNGDYKKLPGEEKIMETMRGQGVEPGMYMFPFSGSMKDMGTPEMIEKYKQGPVAWLTVLPNGPMAIGKSLFQWFVYTVVLGCVIAYVATLAMSRGADFMVVFRLTGAVAMLAYAFSALPESIWKGQSWGVTLKFVFDGVVYGLVTAGTFGWLWPDAA